MRLQPESTPDPRDRALGRARLRSHRPGRPVRGIPRGRLQGLDDHGLDLLVGDRAWSTRLGAVKESVEPISDEPVPPLRDSSALNAERLGDLGIRATARTRNTIRDRNANA